MSRNAPVAFRPGKRAWGITDATFLIVVCILLSVYILQIKFPGGG